MDWKEQAACTGMPSEMFFPEVDTFFPHTLRARENKAKAVCAKCPVDMECLNDALMNNTYDDDWGIFGGLTADERRALRRARRRPGYSLESFLAKIRDKEQVDE